MKLEEKMPNCSKEIRKSLKRRKGLKRRKSLKTQFTKKESNENFDRPFKFKKLQRKKS